MLLKRAHGAAPEAVAHWIERAAVQQARELNHAVILHSVEDIMDDQLARRLVVHLDDDLPTAALSEILSAVAKALPDQADAVARRWIAGGVPSDDRARSLAGLGVCHFVEEGSVGNWNAAWEAIEADRLLGRDVLLDNHSFVSRVKKSLKRVSLAALVRAWQWLAREWPYPEELPRTALVEEGPELRDAMVNEIARRASEGDADAIDRLRAMATTTEAPRWMSSLVQRVERDARRSSWEPWSVRALREA